MAPPDGQETPPRAGPRASAPVPHQGKAEMQQRRSLGLGCLSVPPERVVILQCGGVDTSSTVGGPAWASPSRHCCLLGNSLPVASAEGNLGVQGFLCGQGCVGK